MKLLREYIRGLLTEIDYSLVAGLSGKKMWYLEGDWEMAPIEKIVDNLFGDSPWVLTVADLNRLFEWFHISGSWIGDDVGTVMEPRVPRSPWEDEDGRVIEDEFDPRISLAPTVEKALHALGSPPGGYVYAVDIKDKTGDEIETRVPFGSHCPGSPSNAYGEDFSWEKYASHSGIDPDDDGSREVSVISCVPDQQVTQEVWHRSELWMVDVGKVGPDMKVRLSWDFIRWYGERTSRLGRLDIVPGMTLDPIRSIDADEEKTLFDITQAMGRPEGEYPELELSDKKEVNELMVREYIRTLLTEAAIITGRKLDRYATVIKRHVMNAIKDPEVRDYFKETGTVQFKLQDVSELEDIEYLRDVIITIEEGPEVQVSAAYEFDINATPEQRKSSDLKVNLVMLRDFPDQVLSYVNDELVNAIRHELEHSGQDIEELMDCIGGLASSDDIWSSLKNAAEYYTCPGEIKAHVAGFMKVAKSSKRALPEVIDEELYRIYATGIDKGYSEGDLHSLMIQMRDSYHNYALSRYPQAKGY